MEENNSNNKLNFYTRKGDNQLLSREYTTGITQKEIINKINGEFKKGFKIVILKSGVGSGKSIIGLEVIREFGSGYIVVPRIYHQDQYRRDYSKDDSNFYMKDKNDKITNIQTLKGKDNFECILFNKNPNRDEFLLKDPNLKFCSHNNHICNQTIPIKDKKEICPYYTVNCNLDREFPGKNLFYDSVTESRKIVINTDGEGNSLKICTYQKQMIDCIKNDIVIINSKKLEIENMINRLPQKKVLVIDEFDLFLKEISTPIKFNISKAINSIDKLLDSKKKKDFSNRELKTLDEIKRGLYNIKDGVIEFNYKYNRENLMKDFYEKVFSLINVDEKNYEDFSILFKIDNIRRDINYIFGLFRDEKNSFLSDIKGISTIYKTIFYNNLPKNDINCYFDYINKELSLNLFSLNVSARINKIFDNFDHILLMSGTMQEPYILEEFYGIKGFSLIEGERTIIGRMYNELVGNKLIKCEVDFTSKQKDWRLAKVEQRPEQLKATNEIIRRTKEINFSLDGSKKIRPNRLFHIVNFGLLPEKDELKIFEDLKELGSRLEEPKLEKDLFKQFLDPNSDVRLHKSTKMTRAIDLPDDKCRVIIFQKLPYPPTTAYYKAMMRKYGKNFVKEILKDECRREIIQGATRGIRNKNDWCIVVSPDCRVFQRITEYFYGDNNVFHNTLVFND